MVPEATVAPRISRAKQLIRESGAQFRMPPEHEHAERARGPPRALCDLRRGLYRDVRPRRCSGRADARGDPASARGLAPPARRRRGGRSARAHATHRRATARSDPRRRNLAPLAEQDRGRWDRAQIAEGVALICATLPRSVLGPHLLQAAVAAVHADAPSAEATDWAQIVIPTRGGPHRHRPRRRPR
jgi:hypothetical protein